MLLARGTISNRFAVDLFEPRFFWIEFAYCRFEIIHGHAQRLSSRGKTSAQIFKSPILRKKGDIGSVELIRIESYERSKDA
jgi:hypothetical protein